MTKPKKGAQYICGVCGTTLLVTEVGYGVLEDVVCCEKPMDRKAVKPTKKVNPKKNTNKK